jgi:hypothetical protein
VEVGLACTAGASAVASLSRASQETADNGRLELGPPQASQPATELASTVRVPVYLRTGSDLALAGLSFSVGLRGGSRTLRLRFMAAEGRAPSLVDDGVLGTLAVAWLEGLQASAGLPVLLGWIEIQGAGATDEPASLLQLYGASIDRQPGALAGTAW